MRSNPSSSFLPFETIALKTMVSLLSFLGGRLEKISKSDKIFFFFCARKRVSILSMVSTSAVDRSHEAMASYWLELDKLLASRHESRPKPKFYSSMF